MKHEKMSEKMVRGSILVVDDNVNNLQLLIDILKNAGHTVRPAPNGTLALKSAQSKPPDLVLLDINMPEMNGYEVCEALQSNESTRRVPVIFISAMDETLDKIRAFLVGGVDYITKPFQVEEVLARVDTHLRLAATERQLRSEVALRVQSEEQFRSLSRWYNLILESAGEGILLLDAENRHTYVNPAAAAMLGWEQEELIGRACHETWHHTEGSQGRCERESCPLRKHGGAAPQYLKSDDIFVRCDGSRFHVSSVITTMLGIDMDGSVVIFSDITGRKQLEEELRRLATTDPLTGVHNRRHFLERAEEELQRARRYGHPLTCLMLDIDHFKQVNDTYGHSTGDIVLKEMAGVCMALLRNIDLFGRLGGEEFAVILTETGLESGRKAAERLCRKLAQSAVDIEGRALNYTVSIGVAVMNSATGEGDLDDLLQAADAALYEAKRQGRNRVIAAGG
jgi:two-component system cell cycle response regulator